MSSLLTTPLFYTKAQIHKDNDLCNRISSKLRSRFFVKLIEENNPKEFSFFLFKNGLWTHSVKLCTAKINIKFRKFSQLIVSMKRRFYFTCRLSSRLRRPPYLSRCVASTMARGWRLPFRGCADGAVLKGGCARPLQKGPSPPPLHFRAGCTSRARRVSCSGRNVGSFSPSTVSFITKVSVRYRHPVFFIFFYFFLNFYFLFF